MYKLKKNIAIGVGIVAGTIILPIGATSCSMELLKISQEREAEKIREIEEKEDEKKGILVDQNLNGCVVYKLMTRTRTQNLEQNTFGPWSNWQVSPEFYIGTTTEKYNEEIAESETMQTKKMIMGMIDNTFLEEEFNVTIKNYHEEAYIDGEWEETGERMSLENELTPPPRCLSRWILDNSIQEARIPSKTTENVSMKTITYIQKTTLENGQINEQTITRTVEDSFELPKLRNVEYQIVDETHFTKEYPVLMQKYEISIHDGEFQETPTFVFTTIANAPNGKSIWKPVGHYQKSEDLEKSLNNHSVKVLAQNIKPIHF